MIDVELNNEEIEVEIVGSIDTEIESSTIDAPSTSQAIEVELLPSQWTLVSDAILIRDVTGNEPQWLLDLINGIINDSWIPDSFEDVYEYLNALDEGFTYLVTVTDDLAASVVALKVGNQEQAAAISRLDLVKIDEESARAISMETIGVWLEGGEANAWFNRMVSTVATNTSANTDLISQLSAKVDDVEAIIIESSKAHVDKYINPEWVGPDDPDDNGEPKWIYEARAKHSLSVNANGAISGFYADAYSGPEGEISEFKIFADIFKISNVEGDYGVTPFEINMLGENENRPQIYFTGDVWFGDRDDGTTIVPYTLWDIANDLVIDPVEKNELEKVWRDIQSEYLYLNGDGCTPGDGMICGLLNGRYVELKNTYSGEYDAFVAAYNQVELLMTELGIPKPDNTEHVSSTLDPAFGRDGFNKVFQDYFDTSKVMKNRIEDRVKQLADEAYNLITDIVSDNVITAQEKGVLKELIRQFEGTYYLYEENVPPYESGLHVAPPDPCSPQNDFGLDRYGKEYLHYRQHLMYRASIYGRVGECKLTIPERPYDPANATGVFPDCTSTPAGCDPDNPSQEYTVWIQRIDGIKEELIKYDLDNPVDYNLTDDEKTRITMATSHFLDERQTIDKYIFGTTIDTTFLKIFRPDTPSKYTLIVDDTIQTGSIGQYSAFNEDPNGYPVLNPGADANYFDFTVGRIKALKTDSITFHINSEADGTFVGLCDNANASNFRGKLIEGDIGAFSEMHTGALRAHTRCANGSCGSLVENRIVLFKNGQAVIASGAEDVHRFTEPIRLYAPNYQDEVSTAVSYARIRAMNELYITLSSTGTYIDRVSLDQYFSAFGTIEYRTDDGIWIPINGQVVNGFSNQNITIMIPPFNNYIDFRLNVRYNSKDWKEHEVSDFSLNIMVHNI